MPPLANPLSGALRQRVVETLRQEIARCERPRDTQEAPVSSGLPVLDRLLPAGGFHRGTLVEWLADGDGCGVASLALVAARKACREGGALVVVDRSGEFYPPAVMRLGIEPQELLIVRAAHEADHAWALDQVLRCPAVAAVLAWPQPQRAPLATKTFRRLQLAAEQGGSLGHLIRPAEARHEPSWADVRLEVEAVVSCQLSVVGCQLPTLSDTDNRQLTTDNFFVLRVHLLRGRGGTGGGSVELEIGHETRSVHLDSELAHRADRRRPARA